MTDSLTATTRAVSLPDQARAKPLVSAPALLAIPAACLLIGNAFLILRLARLPSFFDLVAGFYNLHTLWLPPVAALAGAGVLAQRGVGRGWRRGAWAVVALAALAFGARVYATHIEPNRLVVREVVIETDKVSRPIRIVHASDIQSGGVGEREERAIEAIIAREPDLFIYTGDLVQPVPPLTYASELPKMAALLERLDPPLGKFAVIGDTDGPSVPALAAGLGGMRTLISEGAAVEADGVRLRLFGLSLHQSRWLMGLSEPVEAWMESVDAERDFAILFGHGPDFALEVLDLPIDLCLAGHTHGGQVRLPLFGPIITLSSVPRSWARGFREEGSIRLNVSAGLGSERAHGLPMLRVFCPPEFTVIDLVPPGGR